MTIKNDLLKKINKKAQDIRDKRVEAANNKSIEDVVFAFFKNIEDAKLLNQGTFYDANVFGSAKISLAERIKSFDRGAKVSVEYNTPEDERSWEDQDVRGVTIWWSQTYIIKHGVDPSLYIDVSQMLFI